MNCTTTKSAKPITQVVGGKRPCEEGVWKLSSSAGWWNLITADNRKFKYCNILKSLSWSWVGMVVIWSFQVDHSIVESFAQGGRTCITSRVYPTKAIFSRARLFLLNNATGVDVTATSVKIWQMNSAFIRPFYERDSASSIRTSNNWSCIELHRLQFH